MKVKTVKEQYDYHFYKDVSGSSRVDKEKVVPTLTYMEELKWEEMMTEAASDVMSSQEKNEKTHRKGQWIVKKSPSRFGLAATLSVKCIEKSKGVLTESNVAEVLMDKYSNANAHLIAAAPEMLKTLQKIEAYFGAMDELGQDELDLVVSIKETLKKARGES